MKLNEVIIIVKRLYREYVKKYLGRIFVAIFLSVIVAGSTSAIAWLLDPAVKKIFIEQDKTFAIFIPVLVILAFMGKGISLYYARSIVIVLGNRIKQTLQNKMTNNILLSDSQTIESKHSGKYISTFLYDVGMIQELVSTGVLNIIKDSLTLIGLLSVMFYQNWKLSLIAIIMIPLAAIAAKSLGKRISKVSYQQMEWAGVLSSYLIDMFKNHKLIKIFQKEMYEKNRAKIFLENLKEKSRKMSIVFVRASPIMETMTGIVIAILIFYAGKLIMNDELDISNFFSFLAAMMLAYQPVRSLATLNICLLYTSDAADE